MMTQRLFGFMLLIVGVILFVMGINASDSIADRMSNFFTGQYTDATMWYLIGGGACAIGGVMLILLGRRRTITS